MRHLALAWCVAIATGCAFADDTGAPDPGLYWAWVCPDGGTPVDASAPVDFIAAGSCGKGGPFAVSVNGCEMFGSWSALGLSDVQTAAYVGSPARGGWVVRAAPALGDGGAALGGFDAAVLGDGGAAPWTCAATLVQTGGLTFTCSDVTTSMTTCESTLTPASGS
jgi:hypothetical protein